MTNLNNKQSNTASLQWGLNAPTNKMPVKNYRNRHQYATLSYDRKKGVLTKDDYLYVRELLESYLLMLQESSFDRDAEIDRLKQFFIKFDHHIERMR